VGIPLVRRWDGSVVELKRGGFPGFGGPRLSAGDDLVLILPGRFDLHLEVGPFYANQNRRLSLRCLLSAEVAAPVAFARAVVELNERILKATHLGERLGRRGEVRDAVERAFGVSDRESFERTLLRELTDALAKIGLRLYAPMRDAEVVRLGGPTDLAPGQIIGNWHLVRLLGDGAFGQVWLVENIGVPGMLRAMKLVHHPDLVNLITREVRKVVEAENRGMDFQYVARLFDFIPGDAPALVYEYIDGADLGAYVASHDSHLRLEESTQVVTKVLLGLEAIHGAGLVHRDLHPGNIRLVHGKLEDGLKILDLGLAHSINGGWTTTGGVIEPRHPFAEPPSLRGGGLPDALTDVYSVGVLLWWHLTGEVSLPAGRALKDTWPAGPPQFLDIIRRAINWNWTNHFTSATEMRKALAEPGPEPPDGLVTEAGDPPSGATRIMADLVIRESMAGGKSTQLYLDQRDWERLRRNRLEEVGARLSESRHHGGKLDPRLAAVMEAELQEINKFYHVRVATHAFP
jgi:serine/threonine protein kinase